MPCTNASPSPVRAEHLAGRRVDQAGLHARPDRGNRGGVGGAHRLESPQNASVAGASWTVRVKSTQYPS